MSDEPVHVVDITWHGRVGALAVSATQTLTAEDYKIDWIRNFSSDSARLALLNDYPGVTGLEMVETRYTLDYDDSGDDW